MEEWDEDNPSLHSHNTPTQNYRGVGAYCHTERQTRPTVRGHKTSRPWQRMLWCCQLVVTSKVPPATVASIYHIPDAAN
jgi:hypothetical protein